MRQVRLSAMLAAPVTLAAAWLLPGLLLQPVQPSLGDPIVVPTAAVSSSPPPGTPAPPTMTAPPSTAPPSSPLPTATPTPPLSPAPTATGGATPVQATQCPAGSVDATDLDDQGDGPDLDDDPCDD